MRRADLAALYRRARYRVAAPAGDFELRVGAPSPALDALLARHGTTSWAFLTAVNPGSRPLPEHVNQERLAALERRLAAGGWPRYAGAGIDPEGSFPDEPSFLVLGAPRALLLALAAEFGQAAILAGRAGGAPELIFLAAPSAPA
jgi:hypothetical protein